MAFFSVIIPLYNKEYFIGKTIDSVLAQSYQNFEIIIVNDGSTDNSESAVTAINDDRLRYYQQKNKGAAAARNKAISKARGEYIALLDADDVWDIKYLETIKNLIENYPKHQVFATAVKLGTQNATIDSQYSIRNIKKDGVYLLNYFEASNINSILTSSSTVVHHHVFDLIGLYDNSLNSKEDTDLWIRIGLQLDVVFINTCLVFYNFSRQSLSKQNIIITGWFNKYQSIETINPKLKKFLDLNRFSIALQAKVQKNKSVFTTLVNEINLKSLNKKQRVVLKLPLWFVKTLFRFKSVLERLRIHTSIFK